MTTEHRPAHFKKTAIITDAGSPDFLFPLWRQYYGGLFGEANLYVLTYAGQKPLFAASGLQNLLSAETAYSDAARAKLISGLTAMLLRQYDVVLHCDVDEFLVPAPAYEDLADYVARCPLPYVTARGIDLVEMPGDKPLDLHAPILPQRPYGLRATALYKTCLTKQGLHWGGGFHGASAPPRLDDLYLFHLKWADLGRQIAWHQNMLSGLQPGTKEYDYFNAGAGHLTEHQAWLAAKPAGGAETAAEFDAKYLAAISLWQDYGIYQAPFFTQDFLHHIDPAFTDAAPGF